LRPAPQLRQRAVVRSANQLRGPDVDFVGTKTVRVKLARGEYEVYCEPHEATMVQHFIVR
jgi:plastocyanin